MSRRWSFAGLVLIAACGRIAFDPIGNDGGGDGGSDGAMSDAALTAYTESGAATGIDGNQATRTAVDAGAVYAFTRTAGTWAQQAYIKASNATTGDKFGSSIAVSADGSTLAVGAYEEASAATGVDGNQADNAAAGAGAIYIFQ